MLINIPFNDINVLSNRITFHAIFTLITRAYFVLAIRAKTDLALSWSENKTEKEERNKRIRECQTIFHNPFFQPRQHVTYISISQFPFKFHFKIPSFGSNKISKYFTFIFFIFKNCRTSDWTSDPYRRVGERRSRKEGEGRGQRSEGSRGSAAPRYTFGSFHSDFY